MRRFAAICSILFLAAAPTTAPRTIDFENTKYTRQFVNRTATGNIAEYVPDGQTLVNWTTMVAVHGFPRQNKPVQAAAELIKALQRTRPEAKFAFFTKPDDSEAQVDFITWPDDASYAEFNIFRYRKNPQSPGLVAYQFAYRFKNDGPDSADRFKAQRQRWVELMTQVDFPIDFAD